MYNLMKNLIVNKFYNTMEEAVKKISVFFAVDDLKEDQFVELKQLAKEKYEIVKPVEEVKKQEEVKINEIKATETSNTNTTVNQTPQGTTTNVTQ